MNTFTSLALTTTFEPQFHDRQLHTGLSSNLLLPFWEVVYPADRYRFPAPSCERSANASVPDDIFLLNESDLPFPLATCFSWMLLVIEHWRMLETFRNLHNNELNSAHLVIA